MMMGPACFALLSSPGFGFGFKELQKSGKNLGSQMACNRGSPQLQFLWGGESGGEDLHLGGGGALFLAARWALFGFAFWGTFSGVVITTLRAPHLHLGFKLLFFFVWDFGGWSLLAPGT